MLMHGSSEGLPGTMEVYSRKSTVAMGRYLASLFVEKIFGHCEQLYQLRLLQKDVCEYETAKGKVL